MLIGCQGDDRITAEEVAARLGTINYEVVSAILARVPRRNPGVAGHVYGLAECPDALLRCPSDIRLKGW